MSEAESSESQPQVVSGLEGVLACHSSVCFIDGPAGTLRYRGYEIGDFVTSAEFLDVAWLLWSGEWPSAQESALFVEKVAVNRELPSSVLSLLETAPMETANPMAVMRTAVSLLGVEDSSADDYSIDSLWEKAQGLLGRLPTIVAAMSRRVAGRDIVAPHPELGHSANYLYMLTGEPPSDSAAYALNALLNTYAEHELNASTFAARTTVGTLSDYYSAIVTGLGTVKGALHGGAVDDAMEVFSRIGAVENVSPYLDAALAARVKVPGFGHRVYRTRDPRAEAMDNLAETMGAEMGEPHWHAVASSLERELRTRKGLSANVDYYSALVLHHLGFPHKMFTSVIASSRVAGWTAHIGEQYANNRLIRPRALYGGQPARTYQPSSAR